ncbi:hypothetical protein [Rosistilla oblonga]|uniref:hypothetical protein n=1 Tax=Rosistilla oblonga TaxID=2527990 RepID=UPI003A97AFE0
MTWETRGNSKKYFYLSRRLSDGRIRKQYFGRGLHAEVEAIRLERDREIQRRIREEKQEVAAAESRLKHHLRSTSDVVLALMLIQGFTNERSRGWRRLPMIAPNENTNELATAESSTEPSFQELVQAARQGDRSAIPALRRMMQANPELAKNNGDLASQTQIHWIDLIAGNDLYRRECLLMRMADLKRELIADTSGTVVEQMLVDQATSTWLQLYYHEDREAVRPAENIKLGEYRLKKIESAFNRHLRSLNALASLRAINFTKRMAGAMKSITQGPCNVPTESCSHSADQGVNNRLHDSFSRVFESAPMN